MQLQIFDTVVLEHAELVCDSPKKAFWNIRLEAQFETFTVIKESGIGDKVIDTRRWPHDSHDQALKDYRRRLRSKLNRSRKSTRKYEVKKSRK